MVNRDRMSHDNADLFTILVEILDLDGPVAEIVGLAEDFPSQSPFLAETFDLSAILVETFDLAVTDRKSQPKQARFS